MYWFPEDSAVATKRWFHMNDGLLQQVISFLLSAELLQQPICYLINDMLFWQHIGLVCSCALLGQHVDFLRSGLVLKERISFLKSGVRFQQDITFYKSCVVAIPCDDVVPLKDWVGFLNNEWLNQYICFHDGIGCQRVFCSTLMQPDKVGNSITLCHTHSIYTDFYLRSGLFW